MKSIFQSKVFWVAVGQAVIGAIAVFQTSYPALGWLAIAKSVIDVALRYGTTEPVSTLGSPRA